MTINELISELSRYDGERSVYIQNNEGYVSSVYDVREKTTRRFFGDDKSLVMLTFGTQVGMAD